MEVTCASYRLNDDVYVVAEDWPVNFGRDAAKMAAIMLRPGSGYAGSKDLDVVADYIRGLLELPADAPYGYCLMLCRVIEKMPSK